MIKPTQDYVLIRPTPPEAKTTGGILLPSSTLPDGDMEGIVEQVAGKVTELTKGDRVLYNQYGMNEVDDGDTSYHLVREANVYAILNDAK